MNVAAATPKAAHIWARDQHDWYVEPEWCSRRLFEEEPFTGLVYDPACGGGNIIKSAAACRLQAAGSDIVDRGHGAGTVDFLTSADLLVPNIVCNPPFDLAERFVARALRCASRKVALLLPATWHCGDKRSRWLATTPLRKILFLTPRPSMPPGHVLATGAKPGGGTKDFAWYVWLAGAPPGPIEAGWLRRDR
jgi:hypothetical protein